MTDEPALLRAVLDAPDEDDPRLVYADWLEENGQPERAEFIRVQIELARLDEYDPRRPGLERRQDELRKKHAAAWCEPLDLNVEHVAFTRGFVGSLLMLPAHFVERAEGLFELAPITEWGLAGNAICNPPPPVRWDEETFARLAACPHLARLRGLGLEDGHARDDLLGVLFRSPHLTGLERLNLSWNYLSGDGLADLAAANLPRLRELRLCGCEIAEGEFEDLARSKLRRLHLLVIAYNSIGDFGLELLADAARRGWEMKSLDVANADCSAKGVAALLRGKWAASLESLRIDSNELGDDAAKALAASKHLGGLRSLDAGNVGLTPEGAKRLAAAKHLGGLRRLHIGNEVDDAENAVGDEGLAALAHSPHLENLAQLDVLLNGITTKGVEALAVSPLLGRLRVLNLNDNAVGSEGAKALAASPAIAGLRMLGLAGCAIGPTGAQALLDSPHWSPGVCVMLDDNDAIPKRLRDELEKRFPPVPGGRMARSMG